MDTATLPKHVDSAELEQKVKKMYKDVAQDPFGEYHFEMGRNLAEKLGYEISLLDAIPAPAIDSFAGVGHYFHLADIKPGDKVLDLGSGSGMDSFLAALKTGKNGTVTGIDMTDEQLDKSKRLAAENGITNVSFVKGFIQELPFADSTFDVIISNGVINLCPEKAKVFHEAYRVLKPGGRLVFADIVTEKQLPENIVCNSTLWASCIGGAAQQDSYQNDIESAGFKVTKFLENTQYQFISVSALGASKQYGVKSISILAVK
jgi:ubiquinone/menaquinone biosynthesis C-methylase UbiE